MKEKEIEGVSEREEGREGGRESEKEEERAGAESRAGVYQAEGLSVACRSGARCRLDPVCTELW